MVFDAPSRRYHLTSVPEALDHSFGPGGPAFGMGGDFYETIRIEPGVLLAGKSWSRSMMATREPATGKWEPSPTDPLSAFAYQQLTLHGWHQVFSRGAAAVLLLVPALIGLVLLIGAAAIWLWSAPWIAVAIVLAPASAAFGFVVQGPRVGREVRKKLDTVLFWLGVAGSVGGAYLIHLAFEQADRPLGVVGAGLIVAAFAAQSGRR